MPASLFHENQEQINQNIQNGNVNNVNSLEEQRALQLALELSMLGLMNDEDSHLSAAIDAEARLKKSQNTTECVPVPSSEHVAEIVGRQGCKIKALRAKTNTYIKTPVRGEEPVFVVTGRKEDVNSAKREILSAAEHFSQIRAQRKNTLGGIVGTTVNGSSTNGTICNATGQCTIQVRVPYRVVGLVVGPKGATIKRIQQQTSTYIITPSREKEPIFEVTGLPDNVQTARKEIEAHIAIRTGDVITSSIDSGSSGNGSSQADDLDTRDYLNNSPQFGSFVEQLYGNNQQNNSVANNAASVAAVAAKLNGLQLLQQNSTNSNASNGSTFSSMFSGTNGLSSLYSKANGNLENSFKDNFNPFLLNAALNNGTASTKSPDVDNSLFSNFGVDALTRTNLLNHSTSQNGTSNSLSSNGSSSSSTSNLSSNNLLNLCNSSGLNMLNLQNAKNLLNVNNKFADIYSQLLANNGNLSSTNSTNQTQTNNLNQLLQHQNSINNVAVANQLSNGLTQLNVNNSTNSNHSNGASNNQLNGSNTNSILNGSGNNSFNVNSLYERDEGLGDSPTFDSIAAANLANLAVMANVNSNNGLKSTNGNSSSSSVNSTTSNNGISLWPDSTNNSPTNNINSTSSNLPTTST